MNRPNDAKNDSASAHSSASGSVRNWIGVYGGIFLIVILAWRSLNAISWQEPRIDSGVFASAAFHLLEGKTLYRDVWDHKPPVVYVVDAIALFIGGRTIDSVRNAERMFTVIGCLCLYFATLKAFGNRWMAFAAACFFPMILHLDTIFQGGNLTEEYGALFCSAGVLAALFSKSAQGWKAIAACATSGAMFALAILAKEPFLFSLPPWILWIILGAPRRTKIVRVGVFVCGALIPASIFALYLSICGAWSDWLDVLSYNVVYARHLTESVSFSVRLMRSLGTLSRVLVGQTWIGEIFLFLGLIGACERRFSVQYGHLPRILAAAFACDLVGVLMSSLPDGHYCMQIVPAFILLGTSGAMFLGYALRRLGRGRWGAIGAITILLILADAAPLAQHARDLIRPAGRSEILAVSRYIRSRTNETDRIWTDGESLSRIYLETGRLSPTPRFYLFEHHFLDTRRSSAAEKIENLKMDLKRNPPKFIVFTQRPLVAKIGLMLWIRENYSPVPDKTILQNAELWVRRRPL